MTTTTPKPVSAASITEFLRLQLPDLAEMEPDHALARVGWHVRRHLALAVVDDERRIIGAALGRTILQLSHGAAHYVWSPAGRYLWVDAIATTTRAALPALVAAIRDRWPQCHTAAGTVFNRNRELRQLPISALQRLTGA
jgi:hypothetical protein